MRDRLTKQLIRLENKLLEQVFEQYLGRKVERADYKKIMTIHSQNYPPSYPLIDYYHVAYDGKVIGMVVKEVVAVDNLTYKFTFKPADKNDRRTKCCQVASC